MYITPEETEKVKQMFLFLIQNKMDETYAHNGFSLNELQPILEELAQEGKIIKRPTINSNTYFLKSN